VIAIGVGVLVDAADGPASVSTFGGRNGKLVYATTAGVYVAGPNGGSGRRLRGLGKGVDPVWSADGKQLVFARATSAQGYPTALFRSRADGTGVRRLTGPPSKNSDGPSSWFPDGRRILFYRFYNDPRLADEESADLFVVPVGGGQPVRLTRTQEFLELGPAVSPDGRSVVFTREQAGFAPSGTLGGLFLLRTDGTKLKRLTSTSRSSADPRASWSPDGTRIAFSRNGKIYVINADGRGLRRVTQGPRHEWPLWSPDAKWITYCTPAPVDPRNGRPTGPAKQWLMPARGGTARRLPLDPPGCVHDWQALPPR